MEILFEGKTFQLQHLDMVAKEFFGNYLMFQAFCLLWFDEHFNVILNFSLSTYFSYITYLENSFIQRRTK